MAKTVGRLVPTETSKGAGDGGLYIGGEIHEGFPLPTDRKKFRYVRDSINGSSVNVGNHWVEIQVFSKGANVSQGKPVSSSKAHGGTSSSGLKELTNGVLNTNSYISVDVGLQYLQIDLLDLFEIDEIKVWHYWLDGRTYYSNLVQVSEDGKRWYTIFNSEKDGRYVETAEGKTHILNSFSLVNHADFTEEAKSAYQRKNLIDFNEIIKKLKTNVTELHSFGYANDTSFGATHLDNPFKMDGTVEPVVNVNTTAGTSDYNGGFHTRQYPIDKTKTYRATILIKRNITDNGFNYFGINISSNVIPVGGTAVSGNPYFHYFNGTDSNLPKDWMYLVYHIHPVGYTGTTHADSGIYTLDGTKITVGTDYKWSNTSTTCGLRAFHYYSTTAGQKTWFIRPSLELYDSASVPVEYLLKGSSVDSVSLEKMDGITSKEGAYFTHNVYNLANGTYGIYNNYSIPYTIETLPGETLNGMIIKRYTFTPSTQAHINSLPGTWGKGAIIGSYTYKANTKYCASIYMRKVSHHKTFTFGGTASNINGWFAGKVPGIDGWDRYYQYRNGTVTESKTDSIYFSFDVDASEAKIGESIIFDIACPQLEEGHTYPTQPVAVTTTSKMNIYHAERVKPPYTVNLQGTILRPYSDYNNHQNYYPMIFQMGGYYANNSVTVWQYADRLSLYIKGKSSSGWTATATYVTTEADVHMKERNYTLVALNTRDFVLYLNGKEVIKATSSEPVEMINGTIMLNGVNLFSSVVKSFSVLDYALEADEVKQVFGKGFSIEPNGDVYKVRVKDSSLEQANPSYYHFPLTTDYYDTLKSKNLNPTRVIEHEFSNKLDICNEIDNVVGVVGYASSFTSNLDLYTTVTSTSYQSGGETITYYSRYLNYIYAPNTNIGGAFTSANSMLAYPYSGKSKSGSVAYLSARSTQSYVNCQIANPILRYTLQKYYRVAMRVRRSDRLPVTTTNTSVPYFGGILGNTTGTWEYAIPEGDGWYTLISSPKYISMAIGFKVSEPVLDESGIGNSYATHFTYGMLVNANVGVYIDSGTLYYTSFDTAQVIVKTEALPSPLTVDLNSLFNLKFSTPFTLTYKMFLSKSNSHKYTLAGAIKNIITLGDTTYAFEPRVVDSDTASWYEVAISYNGAGTLTYGIYSEFSRNSLYSMIKTFTNTTNVNTCKMIIGDSGQVSIKDLKVYPNQNISYSNVRAKEVMRVKDGELQLVHELNEGGI